MSQYVLNERQCSKVSGVWEEVIATIPQERDGTILEVALMHYGASGTDVELRYMVWGDGLGWYRQSTLTMDQGTARKLLGALGCVRRRLDPAWAAGNGDQDETKVIRFPDGRNGPIGAEQINAPAV
jgi:hypothetical protein